MIDAQLHEIYYKANQIGISSLELPTIPEKDIWEYNTIKNGQKIKS